MRRQVFGRRKREEAAASEAVREAARTTLFAKLAERPDTVCPFLGMAGERTAYHEGAHEEHRCYAFGDPAPLSSEQQTKVCLERGYGNCPRYLRGVLVIPTEELEALRRPRPAVAVVVPPPAGRSRRRLPVVLGALALLLLIGAGVGWALLGGLAGVARETATPPVVPSAATPPATPGPTASSSVEPTPAPTLTPDSTPLPEDVFQFYEVVVNAGDYTLFDVTENGEIVGTRGATFSRVSSGRVELVDAPNGLRHWRYLSGDYAGLSYIFPDSGEFAIREVFRQADGGRSSSLLPEEEL